MTDTPTPELPEMHKYTGYSWRAIVAGGQERTVFLNGAWLVPYFDSHLACKDWWSRYCKSSGEQGPWAIGNEVQP